MGSEIVVETYGGKVRGFIKEISFLFLVCHSQFVFYVDNS